MLRRLRKFEYFEATTIDEAISLMKEYGAKAKILAGGTDLLVDMKRGRCYFSYLINIKQIPDLDSIVYNERDGLTIGGLTTIRAIESSEIVAKRFPLLSQAAHSLGSRQVRNRATIGGNLCNASPAADIAPALIGYGATVDLIGSEGQRSLPIEDLFRGPRMTSLKKTETLTRIRVPNPSPKTFGIYIKHTIRRSVELAIVGIGAVLKLDGADHVCDDARIVLGAVAPTPIRAKRCETLIKGKKLEEGLIEEAGKVASEEASPITDQRATAEYRKEMIPVLVGRAIRAAIATREAR